MTRHIVDRRETDLLDRNAESHHNTVTHLFRSCTCSRLACLFSQLVHCVFGFLAASCLKGATLESFSGKMGGDAQWRKRFCETIFHEI